MATLHLICGLPCAGKTTLARQLERDLPALRLSPDEWIVRMLGGDNDPARRDVVEGTQWEIAVRVVALGVDAILDNGFWTRDERDQWRARAAATGTDLRWYFLDPPLDELRRRIARRNAALPPGCLPIDPDAFEGYVKWWQPAHPDEAQTPIPTSHPES